MKSAPTFLQLALWISRVGAFLIGALGGLFFIMALLAVFNILPFDVAGTFELPIKLKNMEQFYLAEDLHATYQSTHIEVKKANLEVLPKDKNWGQALLYFMGIIFCLLNYFILVNLTHLLENFQTTTPFKWDNSKYIRRIGWLTIAFPLYKYLVETIVIAIFQPHFSVENATIPGFASLWEINFPLIFLGLIILVLAEVFKTGADLQDLEAKTV